MQHLTPAPTFQPSDLLTRGLSPSINLLLAIYNPGGEMHYESKVPCPRTQRSATARLGPTPLNLKYSTLTIVRDSGAPITKGHHAEPHTYRTHAFIFVWSSSSAVNSSQVRTYVRRRRRTTWRPYWSIYALHTSLQFDIGDPFYGQLTAVKSRYPLTSTTWPYRGLRLELIEVKCFLKLTADQVMDFHWMAGSSVFPNY